MELMGSDECKEVLRRPGKTTGLTRCCCILGVSEFWQSLFFSKPGIISSPNIQNPLIVPKAPKPWLLASVLCLTLRENSACSSDSSVQKSKHILRIPLQTWLVVYLPLCKNMTSSVGMMKIPTYGRINFPIYVPNHQPETKYQTKSEPKHHLTAVSNAGRSRWFLSAPACRRDPKGSEGPELNCVQLRPQAQHIEIPSGMPGDIGYIIYIYMGVVQNTFSRTALNRSANRVATAVPQWAIAEGFVLRWSDHIHKI